MNDKGFTLIEIIAILVILGILAAVAVPKYQDFQRSARDRVLERALADGLSTLALQYARISMSNGRAATEGEIAAAAGSNAPSGDFIYAFAPGVDVVTVSVNWTDGTMAGNSTSKTRLFMLP